MAIGNLQTGNYKVLTSSANVKASDGALLGFFCNSTTSGTVKFYDSATTTTTTPITGTITPSAGTWYPIPVNFNSGLYLVLANAINITTVWA